MIGALTKVLLVDDDVELVEMLRDYLEREGFPVTAAHDGDAGVAEALSGDYAIAVLDVMMPGMTGLDVLARIRERSNMPVLMLTARGDDADRVTGLELGADDYVPKPCTAREVLARIRAILRRARPAGPFGAVDALPPAPLRAGTLTMWTTLRRAECAGVPMELTSTEFNLLEVLLRNAGRVVSKEQLSEEGLGRALAPFDRNIEVHLSSVRRKLGAFPSGRDCIKTVYRRGYQLVAE